MIDRRIRELSDDTALRIVNAIGEAHQDAVPDGVGSAELARVLSEAVDTTDVPAPSDGEAASAALQLLAEDHRFAGAVESMASGPQTKALGFGVVEGAFLISGLLLALQTHFEFVRDKDGRWSVKLVKKPTSDTLLKPLIKKLTDLLGV